MFWKLTHTVEISDEKMEKSKGHSTKNRNHFLKVLKQIKTIFGHLTWNFFVPALSLTLSAIPSGPYLSWAWQCYAWSGRSFSFDNHVAPLALAKSCLEERFTWVHTCPHTWKGKPGSWDIHFKRQVQHCHKCSQHFIGARKQHLHHPDRSRHGQSVLP